MTTVAGYTVAPRLREFLSATRRLYIGGEFVDAASGRVFAQCNGFDTAMPFGGFKQSGWGSELGASAIDLYTQTNAVNIAL